MINIAKSELTKISQLFNGGFRSFRLWNQYL